MDGDGLVAMDVVVTLNEIVDALLLALEERELSKEINGGLDLGQLICGLLLGADILHVNSGVGLFGM